MDANMWQIIRLSPLILAVSVTACAVGEDYTPPTLSLPDNFHSENGEKKNVESAWWQSFGDKKLNNLEERALKGNQTRQIMQARILEARGAAKSATGALLPQIGAEGAATRTNLGEQTFDKRFSYYQGGFDASYELDFFGGNRRAAEAANAKVEASEADYQNATLTLTAEVAKHYVLWREYQQQAILANEATQAEETLLSFAKAKHDAKIISDAEFAQTESHALIVKSGAPKTEAMRDEEGYSLSVLLGENAGALNDELAEAQPIPEAKLLPVLSSPAEIIARRPDIKAAERHLAAATAMHGAAFSELFPKISLSALYGVQNSAMFATNPIWALASGVTMPILNFGRINGQIDAADARQAQAFHAYQNAVLNALAEIETALTNVGKEGKRSEALSTAVKDAEKNFKLMEEQEKRGTLSKADVLSAKEQLIELKQQEIISLATQSQNIISLYKALAIDSTKYPL